jgi:hypothetical protein
VWFFFARWVKGALFLLALKGLLNQRLTVPLRVGIWLRFLFLGGSRPHVSDSAFPLASL